MKRTKDILWGGAIASSQYEGGYKEGGKGLDTQDCRHYLKRTSDATTSIRLLTQDIIDEAIDDGVDVIGYIMWGVIDIVSAGSCEMEKRYGVVYVDANNLGQGTYKRYKKDSFKWYHDFIENKHKQFN